MTRLAFIAQPVEYRSAPDVPEWAYFPRLRALFGLGAGLYETFADGMLYGCRNVFFLGTDTDQLTPAPEMMVEMHRLHFQFSTDLRELAPTLSVDGTDGDRLHRLVERSGAYALERAAKPKPRTLAACTDFAVGTCADEVGAPSLTLFRRERSLKPAYAKKLLQEGPRPFAAWMRRFHRDHFDEQLRKLRLLYAPHLDYFTARETICRPEVQHAIRQVASAAAIKRMLGPIAGKKMKTLVSTPIPAKPKAPADPLPEALTAAMTEIARQRHGAIVHGEREAISKTESRIKKPYTELQLLERAIRIMAHRDVMAMHHDFSLVPVASFSARGLHLIESGAPIETTPSLNP